MSQIFPYMNSIRFRKWGKNIDYVNNLPSLDYMTQRVQYERNVLPTDYYPVHQINEEINFQVSLSIDKIIGGAIFTNEGTQLYPINKTAADTLASNISITINSTGIYYFLILLEIDNIKRWFISDEFKIVEWADKKDLIKLTYSDTNNDNGGRFYNSDGDIIWNPSVYYTGITPKKEPTQYDRSVFTSQQNNSQVIRSTPKLVDKVIISCIHETYYDNLSYQLTCNNIYINNIQYAVESVGELDFKGDQADVGDVEIIISRNSNNNYQQFL